MKTFQFKSFLSAIFFVASIGVYAQSVSGTVSSDDGPLPGATVVVKGTSTGASTDFDGNFTIAANDGDVLEVSFVGFLTQEVTVSGQDQISVVLAADNELEEVVVTGYGSQRQVEVTSAVVKVEAEDFNKGAINNAAGLLQGKVAGLQIYNKGGDPNGGQVIRLRGISTVGASVQPLVVIDGVIGASLNNIDPNDIENINVLKDGSASAIYGSRGSSGVILVTTKKGKEGQSVKFSYNGQVAVASRFNSVKVLSPSEFVAAGGTNLGSQTEWIDEVTRSAVTHIHNFSAAGGGENNSYRISTNLREVEGILKNSGFDQFNTRLNYQGKALNDKLTVNFSTSVTVKNAQNGFSQALRYAVMANPTMPIYGADSPYQFNGAQFGGYFESLGLFDSFNPVSIVEQNKNDGELTEFNYNVDLQYNLLDNLRLSARMAEQNSKFSNTIYYPTTSHFNGNATSPLRKGLAEMYDGESSFKLYEVYGKFDKDFGNSKMQITAGYSYNQNNFRQRYNELGDFPDNSLDYSNAIENSEDLQSGNLRIPAYSDVSPDEKIIAFFGRLNLTLNNAIFINASLRQEGSTKLGEDEKWGLFPAVGLGVDLNKYLSLNNVQLLKVRVGYGVTGALPGLNGLSSPIRSFTWNNGAGGTSLQRAANPGLKWEEKAETNFGVEFSSGKLAATLDIYSRDIKDFILNRAVDISVYGVGQRFENAGKLKTSGLEASLNYDLVDTANLKYNTGINFSTYETTLEEYVIPAEMRGELGAPGQNATAMIRVKEGDVIGNIWGPVFEGVDANGSPVFQDVIADGNLITNQEAALADDVDFAVLGNGIPDFELGWTNQLTFGDWSVNAFFRGAFGHSLINTFRAFYEPRLSTQSSYNYVTTDKAVEGLTTARFSSLYVEKADFFKLDNLTISRNIDTSGMSAIDGMSVSLSGQNVFTITDYTGADPEPSLVDRGTSDNGERPSGSDVLAPGIDRRYNYFNSRTFTLGVNIKF